MNKSVFAILVIFSSLAGENEFNKDAVNRSNLFISPDHSHGCCTKFDLVLCLFKSIHDLKLMMFIESGTLLKNYSSCNFMLKY